MKKMCARKIRSDISETLTVYRTDSIQHRIRDWKNVFLNTHQLLYAFFRLQ